MILHVTISFSVEPPKFDQDDYEAQALTCSDADSLWTMTLPSVAGTDSAPV